MLWSKGLVSHFSWLLHTEILNFFRCPFDKKPDVTLWSLLIIVFCPFSLCCCKYQDIPYCMKCIIRLQIYLSLNPTFGYIYTEINSNTNWRKVFFWWPCLRAAYINVKHFIFRYSHRDNKQIKYRFHTTHLTNTMYIL